MLDERDVLAVRPCPTECTFDHGVSGRSLLGCGGCLNARTCCKGACMADALDVPLTYAFLIAALARVAQQGLLDAPAPDGDATARVCQAMLIESGLLAADPIGPTPALREAMPPGTPSDVIGGMMRDQLAFIS